MNYNFIMDISRKKYISIRVENIHVYKIHTPLYVYTSIHTNIIRLNEIYFLDKAFIYLTDKYHETTSFVYCTGHSIVAIQFITTFPIITNREANRKCNNLL